MALPDLTGDRAVAFLTTTKVGLNFESSLCSLVLFCFSFPPYFAVWAALTGNWLDVCFSRARGWSPLGDSLRAGLMPFPERSGVVSGVAFTRVLCVCPGACETCFPPYPSASRASESGVLRFR